MSLNVKVKVAYVYIPFELLYMYGVFVFNLRRYMVKILPIRRKTLSDQSINVFNLVRYVKASKKAFLKKYTFKPIKELDF